MDDTVGSKALIVAEVKVSGVYVTEKGLEVESIRVFAELKN